LVLRQRTAEARGFGDDINLPVLAKLMLAERFLPRLFDQIATAAAAAGDGSCTDVAAFEAALREAKQESQSDQRTEGGKTSKVSAPKQSESVIVAEWLTSPSIRAWAEVSPTLGTLDLRAYLFVAKDRKDYFGAASVLGHISSIAEQLLGTKFAVQSLEPELKRLAPAEAAQVFELVRGRIVGGDQFDTEPAGVAGLSVLVKAHPTLEEDLLNFLEGLPQNRLGAWPCSGWQGVIKSPAMIARFEALLSNWSTNGSAALKLTAKTALRTRKSG
jgi:hypothetical protein